MSSSALFVLFAGVSLKCHLTVLTISQLFHKFLYFLKCYKKGDCEEYESDGLHYAGKTYVSATTSIPDKSFQ